MPQRLRAPRGASLALALALVLIPLLPTPAGATVMKYMSVEELARASSDVVRGSVLGQTSRWSDDGKGIVTFVDVLVLERVKGHRPLPQVIQIVHPGGELDGTRMMIVGGPVYRDGEEAFFFLSPYSNDPIDADEVSLIGGKMGKMPVIQDDRGGPPEVLRELADVEFAEFVDDNGKPATSIEAGRSDQRIPIEQFRERVRGADAAPGRGRNRP